MYYTTNGGAAPEEIPEEFLPEDPDDYAYVRWVVNAVATGSQPFEMTITDTLPDDDYEKYGARILFADGLPTDLYPGGVVGPDEGSDGKSLTALLYNGYDTYTKSAVIWTAYPRAEMIFATDENGDIVTDENDEPVITGWTEGLKEGEAYKVKNNIKVNVVGWDDQWDGIIENADWENKSHMFREGIDYTVTGEDEDGNEIRETKIVKELATSGEARVQFPITYRVTKVWDDNDNEKGHRPSSQYIKIYRDGLEWKTIYLSEMDNAVEIDPNDPEKYIYKWTYKWDDGGQPHTYYVEERYLAYGYEHWDYVNNPEEEDYRLYLHWWYTQTKKVYNETTHTWTFTNKYNEDKYKVYVIPFSVPGASLSTYKREWTYIYDSKTSSTDRLLNTLRRDESVTIPYEVWGRAYNMAYTYDGEDTVEGRRNVENYGKKTVRFELTDTNLYVTDKVNFPDDERVLEPGDYDIASVYLYSPSLYSYRQPYTTDEDGNQIIDRFVSWNYYYDSEATANAKMEVWGRSKLDDDEWGEWVLYAYKINGVITSVQDGVTFSGSTVYLPKGVHQIKTRIDSTAAEVYMDYTVYIRINPTEHFKEFLERAFEYNQGETYAMLSIRNLSKATVSYPDEEEAKLELSAQDTAYIHGRNFRNAVSLDKEYVKSNQGTMYEQDSLTRKIIFTNRVTLTLQSSVTDSSTFRELVADGTLPNTQGGTYYDLLPEGVQPDLDSIQVDDGEGNDKVLDAYVIENFKDTGRTLLVVKVSFSDHFSYAEPRDTAKNRTVDSKYPENGWRNTHTLTYKSDYAYSEMLSRSVDGRIPPLVNAVAFEANETALASILGWRGEPDDPTAKNNTRSEGELIISDEQDFRDVMTNLDPYRDDNNFVYASAKVDITGAAIYATFQGEKEVSADGTNWGKGTLNDVWVHEGNTYSYRVRLIVDPGSSASGIIFYDPLEACEPTSGEPGYDPYGYWYGKLESVDVAQLVSMGIAPVVYYYTGDAVLPDTTDELIRSEINYKTGSGWTTNTEDLDFSKVRAVVVDATMGSDGEPYILRGYVMKEVDGELIRVNTEQTLALYLHMRSPRGEDPFKNSDDRNDQVKNAHAFNRSYIKATITEESKAIGITTWNNTNFTKVGIIPYSIEVEKEWDDLDNNDNVRPESITVDLYANGGDEPVDTITITEDEDGNWHGTFEHVQRFDDDFVPIEYTIKEREVEGYTATIKLVEKSEEDTDDNKVTFKITNYHERIKTSIPFEKIWDLSLAGDDSNDRPEKITVELYRKVKVKTVTTDEDGNEIETETEDWKFEDIQYLRPDASGNWKGSFDNKWKYENGEEIIYTVREVGIKKYITSYDESTQNQPKIINTYYPFGDLSITKTIENATAIAEEKGVFTFNLILSYNGTEVVERYKYVKTDADGNTLETGTILGVSTFTLKAGETLLIKDIRSETDYQVIESAAAGYTLKTSSGTKGKIVASETSKASFINSYQSSAGVTLTATKELTGHNLSGYQFRFVLKDKDGNEIGTTNNAASNDTSVAGGSASVTFPTLNYTRDDDGETYYYTISEVVPDPVPSGYTYDKKVYGVSVYVEDNGDGTMKTDVKYLGEVAEGADLEAVAATVTESVGAPTFHNEYHASGELVMKAWKTLKGAKLSEYVGKFQYEIVDEEGKQLVAAINDNDGIVEFPAIEYDETDVSKSYLYIVREIDTHDERVIYDTSVFGYIVRVLDQGDGNLTFRQTIVAVKWDETEEKYVIDEGAEKPDPIFRNELHDGSLTVSKYISWAGSITDPDTIASLRDKEFTFKVRFYGETLPNEVTPEEFLGKTLTVGIEGSGATYRTFQEAFDAAEDGDEILVLSDITISSTQRLVGKDVRIDGNGFTINGINGSTSIYIGSDAVLTIEGGNWNLTASTPTNGSNLFETHGKLIINDGTFSGNSRIVYSCPTNGVVSMRINGGHFASGFISTTTHSPAFEIYGGTFASGFKFHVYAPAFEFVGGGSFTVDPRTTDFFKRDAVYEGYTVKTGIATIPGWDGTVYTVIPDPDAHNIAVNARTGKEYFLLAFAFADAQDGDTIRLLSDCTNRTTVNLDKNINVTFDLNGYTLTNDTSEAGFYVTAGVLTVKGGTWKAGNSSSFFSVDGTNYGYDSEWDGYLDPGGKIIIESGTFDHGDYSYYDYDDRFASIWGPDGLTINGGHFESGSFSFDSYKSNAYIKINGGTFGESVRFSGGYTRGFIYGGSFAVDPSNYNGANYVAIGYKSVEDSETEITGWGGTVYTVVVNDNVPEIAEIAETGEKYVLLYDAFNSAEDGQTIKLLADCDLEYISLGDKKLSFDTDGHTITVPKYARFYLAGTAELTVSGGTWYAPSDTNSYIFQTYDSAKLIINGGSFNAPYNSNAIFYIYGTTYLEINGGTFNGSSGRTLFSLSSNSTTVINGGKFVRGTIYLSGQGAALHIKGGTFGSGISFSRSNNSYRFAEGGSYIFDPSTRYDNGISYVALGYKSVVDSETEISDWNDTVYTVVEDSEASAVAKIGETEYKSLGSAFGAAEDGQTIELLADCTLESVTLCDRQITLDAGDHTITVPPYTKISLYGTAELAINGGTWYAPSNTFGNIFFTYDTARLMINGGSYDAPNNTYSMFEINGSSYLEINGGTFSGSSGRNLLAFYETSAAVINAGEFIRGSINISNSNATLHIRGGKFRSGISFSITSGARRFMEGGSYTFNPNNYSNYVAYGYKVVTGAASISEYYGTVYTVVEDPSAPAVAKIGETEYKSLGSAFDAAEDGQTIELVSDFMLESITLNDRKLTLDAGDHTITIPRNTQISLNGTAELTVNGGSWYAPSNTYRIFYAYGTARLIINGGSYNSPYSTYSMFEISGSAYLEINGGTFAQNSDNNLVNLYSSCKMVINGGHFETGTIYVGSSSDLQIKGGTFGRGISISSYSSSSKFIEGGSYAFKPNSYVASGYKVVTGITTIPNYRGTVYTVVPEDYEPESTPASALSAYPIMPMPAAGRNLMSSLAVMPMIASPVAGINAVEPTTIPVEITVTYKDGTLTIQGRDTIDGQELKTAMETELSAHGVTKSYVTSIVTTGKIKLTGSAKELFRDYTEVTSISLSALDTSGVTSMYGMFSGCSGLTSLDVSSFSTGNVTSMISMFSGCSKLTSLDVSGFNTSNVTNMQYMFKSCYKLESLNLQNFNTSNVTNMNLMFGSCRDITSLDISGFDTSKVVNLDVMFFDTKKLTTLKLGPQFSFKGNGATSCEVVTVGLWKNVDKAGLSTYTSKQLAENYDGATMSGTWVISQDYTVKFTSTDANAVIFTTTAEYDVNEASESLPEAFLMNHTFKGWKDEASGYTYDVGETIPARRYSAGQTVTLTAVFEAKQAPVEDETGVYTFTLKGGETKVFNNLPASVQYEVWELTEIGWVLVSSSGSAGTIKPLETSKAIFSNRYDPTATTASISATKYLDNAKAESGKFSFTLHQISGPVTISDITKANGAGGIVNFGQINYNTEGIYVYEISEQNPGSAYTYDTHTETVKVYVYTNVATGMMEATVEYDADGAVFQNYTNPATLTITKAVTSDEVTQENKEGKEFSFKLTLTNKLDQPLTSGYAMNADGELTPYIELPDGSTQEITTGSVTFTLKAGETATVGNIPEGAKYSVEETDLPAGWQIQGNGTVSGKTVANGSHYVNITNTYVPGSVATTFAGFTAYKELVGETLTSGQFSFKLHQVSGPVFIADETVTNGSLINDETSEYYNKYAIVRFSDITYTEPGIYVYEITEVEGDDSTVIYDEHKLTYTVEVKDDGEGRLYTEITSEGSNIFTNRMKTGSLKVLKAIENATEEAAKKEFTFTLTFADRSGNELADEYDVTVTRLDGTTETAKITSGGTVSIKGGESFVVTGLPHQSTYTVVEGEAKGFTKTAVTGENVTGERTAEGTIEADAQDTVSYVNTYSTIGTANEYESNGEIVPALKKVFKGGVIGREQFKFELRTRTYETVRNEEGEYETVYTENVVDTAYAALDGTISFGKLDFTYADDGKTYEYWVYEIDTGDADITYDLEPIKITVEVHDNGEGEMTATVTYDENDARHGTFTNYGISDLTITKAVYGSVEATEFTYTISFTKDGAAYELGARPEGWEKVENEAGTYTFKLKDGDSTTVRLPYGVEYRIAEEEGEYIQTHAIKINRGTETVYGIGGEIVRTIGEAGGEDITYTNSLFELNIAKAVEADAASTASDEFNYTISFTWEDMPYDPAVPDDWEKVENEAGTYTFKLKDGKSYTVELPYGVDYSISEADSNDYQESYSVTVNGGYTTESKQGTNVSRTIGELGNETVTYTNIRLYDFSVTKELQADPSEAEFSFEISFTRNGEAYDPAVPLEWTKTADGTYTFTLKSGETTSIVKLLYDVEYTLTEKGATKYNTSFEVNGEKVQSTGKGIERTVGANEAVTVINNLPVELTIAKNVTGNMGSRTQKFSFTIVITESNGDAYEIPESKLPDGWTKTEDGTYTFQLGHGETVTVELPYGATYTLTETDAADYTTTYTVTGESAASGKTLTRAELKADETVTFVNNRTSAVPTGVNVVPGISAMLILPAIGLLALVFARRKKETEE